MEDASASGSHVGARGLEGDAIVSPARSSARSHERCPVGLPRVRLELHAQVAQSWLRRESRGVGVGVRGSADIEGGKVALGRAGQAFSYAEMNSLVCRAPFCGDRATWKGHPSTLSGHPSLFEGLG